MSVAEAPPERAPESEQNSRPEPSLQTVHTPIRELSWVPDLTDLSTPSRRMASGRSPRKKWAAAILIGVLALLITAAATFVVARSMRPSASVGVPNPLRPMGTLISTSTLGTNQLVVRTPTGQAVTISVAGKRLVTADGYSLAFSSFRAGDTMSATSGAVLVDRSQRRVSLLGRVAISLDPDGTVMTVQLTPTRSILVDINSKTQINGDPPSVRSRMSIEEADQVRIVGFLDTTLDEITQTVAIDRIAQAGPAGFR